MSTKSIKLYDILVEKGVDKDVAREALAEFITRDETENFATKSDIADAKNTMIMWMVGLQVASTSLLIATKVLG